MGRPHKVHARNARGGSRIRSLACLLCLALLAFLPAILHAESANTVHAVAERVDAHYNRLQTLQADFTETYSGAGVARTESGVLWLKRPGRMRWEYMRPENKLFISDGKTAWFYIPGQGQVRRTPVKNLDDLRSPLAYLLGHAKLEQEFSNLSVASDVRPEAAGGVVLRGIPRRLSGIVQVIMEVMPDGSLARIQATQEDGASTDFRFVHQKDNLPVSGDRFQFRPPAGVETIVAEPGFE